MRPVVAGAPHLWTQTYRESEEYGHLEKLNLANPCAEEEHLSLSTVVNLVQETQHM